MTNTPAIAPLLTSSIYEDPAIDELPFDGQTFPSSQKEIFEKLVKKHQPKTIIEVGTHKGGSAMRWAKLAGPECRVYCVDTWLEAADAVLCANKTYTVYYRNGHPVTYWQFLKNMKEMGVHKQITPIINTSSEGAIILAAHKVTAPLIYIDGSHTYRACYHDICDYWKLLEPGGSMLIDDLVLYPDVYAAVMHFCAENKLFDNFEPVEDKMFALLSKPSA